MSVVGSALEHPESPQATFEQSEFRITRKFKVQCSAYTDGPIVATVASGIPRLFDTYTFGGTETQAFCRCRSISANRIEPNSLFWIVTAEYSTPEKKDFKDASGTGSEVDGQWTNPLLELALVETSVEVQQIPITSIIAITSANDLGVDSLLPNVVVSASHFFVDADVGTTLTITTSTGSWVPGVYTIVSVSGGKATLNESPANTGSVSGSYLLTAIAPCKASTGEIFVPPPNRDQSRFVLTITRNEAITSPYPITSVLYADTVNSDYFWGCPPGQCKIQSITATREVKQMPDGSNFVYLKVKYIIHFKDNWDMFILDSGTYYLTTGPTITGGPPPKQIKLGFKGDDGTPIQGLLDGTGKKLSDGASPVYITVRPYQRLPFAALSLPTGFQDAGIQ